MDTQSPFDQQQNPSGAQTRGKKTIQDQTKVNLVITQRPWQFPEVDAGGNSSHLGHPAQCPFGERRTWKTPCGAPFGGLRATGQLKWGLGSGAPSLSCHQPPLLKPQRLSRTGGSPRGQLSLLVCCEWTASCCLDMPSDGELTPLEGSQKGNWKGSGPLFFISWTNLHSRTWLLSLSAG